MNGFNTYLKVSVPAKSLIVVDLGRDRMDGQIAACVLQGIVNRNSEEKIYVMNTYCYDNKRGGTSQVQIAGPFLDILFSDLPIKHLPLANVCGWPGLSAMLNKFESHIKGLIIWDPKLEQATIEAAATIAGQTDYIVVSPEIAETLGHTGLEVKIDLRQYEFKNNLECLDWLLENWFDGAAKEFAFTWSHMTTDGQSWGPANKDYVVAMRLFTFYLDITDEEESKHYIDVLKHYPQGTAIMGWTDERWSDALFAKLGYFMVPYISVENLTVHSSFPSTSGAHPGPAASEIKSNAVYIAMFVADGDNLLHSMVYEPDTIINSTAYGEIPMTWIINPGLVDLAPRLFDWYYENMGNQEFGAMLSDGHPHSDRYAAFKSYCDFCGHYMKRAGMFTLKQMEESEAAAWNIQPYVMNSGYAGTCPKGIREYEYHMDGDTFHIGSIKLIDGPESVRDFVKNSPLEGPWFMSIFAGTAVVDLPQMVKDLADELKASESDDGVTYHFIRSMDLAATYRKWKGLTIKPR